MKNNIATKKISTSKNKPTREEAKQAVKTMLAWAGDNPDREGLLETPERVVSAYEEYAIMFIIDKNDKYFEAAQIQLKVNRPLDKVKGNCFLF